MWTTLLLVYFIVGLATTGALIAAAVMSGLVGSDPVEATASEGRIPGYDERTLQVQSCSVIRGFRIASGAPDGEEAASDLVRDAQVMYEVSRGWKWRQAEAGVEMSAASVTASGCTLVDELLKQLATQQGDVYHAEARRPHFGEDVEANAVAPQMTFLTQTAEVEVDG